MDKLHVDLPRHGYDIFIGDDLSEMLLPFLAATRYSKALIVSDVNVGQLYLSTLHRVLATAGLMAEQICVPAGETAKSLAEAEKIYTRAIEVGLDRRSVIFALGGGVVGDLAGFIAATYMRGIPFLQVPTTLLAQVDSSVGGKVAVNHPLGKNLIGAFYQPEGVFMDLTFLDSLPQREICTGLGEIVKYGVICDEAFFQELEEKADRVRQRDRSVLRAIVRRSCEIKAAVVGQDEREAGPRRILNFGHTLGHAVEKETGYVRYNHGEAVAIGMMGAAFISASLGLVEQTTVERLASLLTRLSLPIMAEGCAVDPIYADIFHDKKTVGGRVTWVLMEGIGRVKPLTDVPEAVVKDAIRRMVGAS
ncbi:MAG: 3-dehydroquinate synthase [Schwartzia sp. (in: firmicutes)]